MHSFNRVAIAVVAVAAPVLVLATPAMAATTVALWHMETVPTMTDSSGSGNAGTASTGVTTVPGRSGNGYHFSGTGHVTVPNKPSLNPGSADFSVTVNVRFTAAPSTDYDLIRKGLSSATGGEWKMEIYPASGTVRAPAYCLFKDSAGKVASVRGTTSLNDGAWHTVTCAKTSTAVKLTVDGATFTNSVALGSISNTANLVVGQKLGGGDQYAGDMDEVSITSGAATGGDTTPPTVTTRTPASGATNVLPTAPGISATLSEAVQNVTGSTFKLKNASTGNAVAATVSLDSTKTVATLQPGAALAAGTKYTATLTAGIQDLAGNALTATSWSFTTGSSGGDTTPPTVTAKSPLAGATGVSTGTDVTATFSEPVQNATATTFKLKVTSSGTAVAGTTVSLDSTGTVATLHPGAALAAGTKYTATLTAGIKDLAGNALTSTSWSFTTAP